MSGVGVATILLGISMICTRVPLVVAPRRALLWVHGLASSDARIRTLGFAFLPLGVLMIWVGDPADGDLSGLVMFLGLWIVTASLLLLIVFPSVYRSLVEALTPREPEGNLLRWRLLGLVKVGLGVVFIYVGILAL